MKKWYSVITNTLKEIPISEEELPKAIFAFVNDKSAVFNEGACQKILSVTPDRVRSMGWNAGYKIQPEDHKDIQKTFGRSIESYLAEVKNLAYESKTLLELESKINQNLLHGKN